MEKEVLVRLRLDGVLQTIQALPKKVQLGTHFADHTTSKLDISEKRLPQDGRISVHMEGRPDPTFPRVVPIPCKWGEKVCLRILDKSNTASGLEKLIPTSRPLRRSAKPDRICPDGIWTSTGPTGSGEDHHPLLRPGRD